jgi:hypothetical protein
LKTERVGNKKRSGGTFLGALTFFLFFLGIVVGLVLAGTYAYRDKLLIELIRQEGPGAFGVEVLALDSIVTRPVGQISVELRGLVFQSSKDAPTLRAEKILLSTPNNLLDLYQLTFSKNVLHLKAQFIGLQIQATTNKQGTTPPPQPMTTNDFASTGLPLPIELETELRDSQLEFGPESKPVRVTKLTGIIRTQISTNVPAGILDVKSAGQLALGVAVGGQTMLPLRTEWSLNAQPKLAKPTDVAITIESLTIATLGLSLKSSGTLKWPEQLVTMEASGSTTDLGVLPLDKAESEALGLSGRLKGAADVSIKMNGDLKSVVTTQGLIRVKGGEFPFALNRQTPRPFSVQGPVQFDLDAPFKISYDIANAKLKTLDLQLASFRADLTAAEVRVDGFLRKPAQLMMAAKGQVTAEGETIDLTNTEFRLANLLMAWTGQISLDSKRSSKLDLALTLPNLSGWPALLPVLGTLERTAKETVEDINRATGSVSLKAKLELPLAAPETISTDSKFEIELLDVSDFEIPVNLNIEKSKLIATGRARGHINAAGTVNLTKNVNSPLAWSLRRATGSFDARDLAISFDDKFKKRAGQEALVSFTASAPSSNNLKFEKLDLRLIDSSANVTGTVSREENGDYALDTMLTSRMALTQMYEVAPVLRPLRAKLPSGTAGAQIKLSGVYNMATGPSTSPLIASGRLTLKSPQAVILATTQVEDVTKSEIMEAPEKPEATIFNWPIFAKSNLVFDLQLETMTLKSRALKKLNVLATLADGNLKGTGSVENAFGGPIKLLSFSMLNLPRNKMEDLKFAMKADYKSINLSALAEFANPQWKTVVAGLASGEITMSGRPFSKSPIADNAVASGTLSVKQASFSTAPIDQMVTQKLYDFPAIAKLMGQKPKLPSSNINLLLNSNFSYADGRMNLKSFTALSPEKNELNLNGWVQKDFKIDMNGIAHLADTPIGGSFRQANSDSSGRLVVPIHVTGSLKEPSLSIAEDVIAEMTKKTVALEANKLKNTVQQQATKAIDQKKKEAVDAVKAELKKRGLSF